MGGVGGVETEGVESEGEGCGRGPSLPFTLVFGFKLTKLNFANTNAIGFLALLISLIYCLCTVWKYEYER